MAMNARSSWRLPIGLAGFCIAAAMAAPTAIAQQQETTPASPGQQKIQPEMRSGPSLEEAFNHMYRLQFPEARIEIAAYQNLHPNDALGKAAEAAAYLFEEFEQKGVLTSAFFLDDKRFLGGVEGSPEVNRNLKFLEANRQARAMAQERLRNYSRDPDPLLVLSIADGMESNYDAMIEKKQLASLSMLKQADAEATKVLSIDPDAKDAYVSLGSANYIIGCLPGYKKAFLWFGGVHGDKQRGIEQMQSAASGGHFLRPFAKIMLALAYEREHQYREAGALLAELHKEFPENPHFSAEMAIAEKAAGAK
jgi:tetratricopeptide (TPR) repeat protein